MKPRNIVYLLFIIWNHFELSTVLLLKSKVPKIIKQKTLWHNERFIFLSESGEARETFGGKLTPDFIVEKLGHSNFLEIKQLELPQSSIRGVDLNNQFRALKCINLEHNQLTNFSGLIHLPNLKVGKINKKKNHVEFFFGVMFRFSVWITIESRVFYLVQWNQKSMLEENQLWKLSTIELFSKISKFFILRKNILKFTK